MNLNKVLLIGRATRDAELRATPSGQDVASFPLATNRSWTENGTKREETEFHSIVCWGGLAKVAGNFIKKNTLVCVEGRIHTRERTKGVETFKVFEIVAESIQLGPK